MAAMNKVKMKIDASDLHDAIDRLEDLQAAGFDLAEVRKAAELATDARYGAVVVESVAMVRRARNAVDVLRLRHKNDGHTGTICKEIEDVLRLATACLQTAIDANAERSQTLADC